MSRYRAYRVEEGADGKFYNSVKTLDTDCLPQGEVLIRVHYSSLNYKDALSATGNRGVTRTYPHTPGIDAAGIVEYSENEHFTTGDKVIVTGYDLGMNTDGGFGQYIRVPSDWVVPLPDGLTLREAMILGTAGFTAAYSVLKLSETVAPEDGEIVVSGATGGVGSMAINILHKIGYSVVAISGKTQENDFLHRLGAREIIDRHRFETLENKPIFSARFAGGIDTTGGKILENIIKSVKMHGAVTTCGSVAGTDLGLSVFPFILRAVSLVGISSQNCPMPVRLRLWQKLATEWRPDFSGEMFEEIALDRLSEKIACILAGKVKGRITVDLR